ncbi:hypothetical protein [Geomicrobium sp. JCM 19039]|uniref:hypothetical protein n=1 Tax=Geomicrobium sp. JCM 19039 TaxID=1460636 RepID=UPI00045F2DF4|nr:hypothetical protein [Geomicrobium sp. JCM 19039]GAK12224.1 hypothetical protein JCM19039_1974 [Geomicrobium sp. JCM 19039]
MRIDQNNKNVQLIIAALASMVQDEGKTPREAFKVLEDIKQDTYFALAEMGDESGE